MYLGTLLSLISSKPRETEIILEAKHKDMILKYILKRGSDENLDNFFWYNTKLLNNKKQLMNVSKQ